MSSRGQHSFNEFIGQLLDSIRTYLNISTSSISSSILSLGIGFLTSIFGISSANRCLNAVKWIHESCYPSSFEPLPKPVQHTKFIEWLVPDWKHEVNVEEKVSRMYVNYLFLNNPLDLIEMKDLTESDLDSAFQFFKLAPEQVNVANISPKVNALILNIQNALRGQETNIFKNGVKTIGQTLFIGNVVDRSSHHAESFVYSVMELDADIWVQMVVSLILHREYDHKIVHRMYSTFRKCISKANDYAIHVIIPFYLEIYKEFKLSFPLPLSLTDLIGHQDYEVERIAHFILKEWDLDQFEFEHPIAAYCFFKGILFSYSKKYPFLEDISKAGIKEYVYSALHELLPQIKEIDSINMTCATHIEQAFINFFTVVNNEHTPLRFEIAEIIGTDCSTIDPIVSVFYSNEQGEIIIRKWFNRYIEIGKRVNLQPILKCIFNKDNLIGGMKYFFEKMSKQIHSPIPNYTAIRFLADLQLDLVFEALKCVVENYTGRTVSRPIHPKWVQAFKILIHWSVFIPNDNWETLNLDSLSVSERYTLFKASDVSFELGKQSKVHNLFYLTRLMLFMAVNTFDNVVELTQTGEHIEPLTAVKDAMQKMLSIFTHKTDLTHLKDIVSATTPTHDSLVVNIITFSDITEAIVSLFPKQNLDTLVPIVGYFASVIYS